MVVSVKPSKVTSGVLDYVHTALPRNALMDLFTEPTRGPYVCRAVLQQLSPVAQQVVLRLTCTGGSFPLAGVQVWITSKTKHEKVLKELEKWSIIEPGNDRKEVRLTEAFATGLKESLCNLDSSPWTSVNTVQIRALEQDAGEKAVDVTPEFLERYTQEQWDAVLHYLVGTVGQKEPPGAVIHFLLETGLMQPDPEFVGDEDSAPLVITERGYDFMLKDNHQQVWHLVAQYLQQLPTKGEDNYQREALLLLICLSYSRVGEAYLASSLSKTSRKMIKHLTHFGLLYTRKIGKSSIFYPTKVAMQLVGAHAQDKKSTMWSLSSKALDAALAHPRPHDSSHLAIIVQTNFQLCAYTTSELHVSMLGLFCDVQTIRRLPNIVFMVITRDSVKSAFALGIQAHQILRFLEKHAHPKLRTVNVTTNNGGSPVPSNVIDQIWLWDRERRRVRFTEVYSHTCLMPGEFRAIHQYAAELNALVWSSEQRQLLYINYAFVERVQNYAIRWRARSATRDHRAEED